MKRISLILLFLVFMISFAFAQEQITITTYYPSPVGSYRELRTLRFAVGTNAAVAMPGTDGEARIGNNLIVDGNVGIGVPNTAARLDVQGRAQFGTNDVNLIDSLGQITGINSTNFATLNGSALTDLNASNLASGTVPSARVSGGYTGITAVGTLGSLTVTGDVNSNGIVTNGIGINNGGNITGAGDIAGKTISGFEKITSNCYNGGTVDVQVVRTGTICYNAVNVGVGFCGSCDIAEYIKTKEKGLELGDVVIINEKTRSQLAKSTKEYDTAVAGVVSSEKTAFMKLGGCNDKEKALLSVVGQVPTKVTAINGPIKPGDLLVTSSIAGHAMKANPKKLGFGMIIGKALEPFSGGPKGETKGKILVLVNLQ